MTNNRKPVDEVRLSLSAARRREAGTHLYERLADKDMRDKPYTPPPAVAAWLQAQADKPKGRDYDAILRAAKKAPVGYYEDAPRGIRFGDNPIVIPDNYPCECRQRDDGTWVHLDESCKVHGLAPTPPQSADGGKPLLSAGSKPHGKDVDTADGPWPKCTKMAHSEEYHLWRTETEGIWFNSAGLKGVCGTPSFTCAVTRCNRIEVSRAEMAGFLEAHGHADAAAQLRVKPRDDVATGGGRVWRGACCDWAVIGERCYIGPSRRDMKGGWEDSKCDPNKMPDHWPELFGPERDAILSECRKAMGL